MSHDRIRVAAITAGSRAEPTAHQLLRVDEILFPDADALSPNNLPSVSALTPLLKTALARLGVAGGQAAITL
ncbi:MAG: hypothetical protein O7D32_00850, partial [bacterium]|nr:hypothetical protein [bacterium]